MTEARDAVVVGSGPNGLAAAIALAREGRSVLVLEANPTFGGGARSEELTLPGYTHDLCSAVHPLARTSPFFAELPLERHGLEWIEPPIQLAHPLDDGSAVLVHRDLATTVASLGADGGVYDRLVGTTVREWDVFVREFLGPLPFGAPFRHPISVPRFGLRALQPATWLLRQFHTIAGRALFAGVAAHAQFPLNRPTSGAFGITLLAAAHAVGWPMPHGGSGRIADALVAHLTQDLGGEVQKDRRVAGMDDLPAHRAALFDVTPRQLLGIAGDRLHGLYAWELRRYRYGPGCYKLDLALDGPIPWTNQALTDAGTVHLGGTAEEIVAGEAQVARGKIPRRPFVLLSQPSMFDPSRAPAGKHTVWAYCHVPNGSTQDASEAILGQIERFAPGFRERIIGVSAMGPAAIEARNANHVGGEINGGVQDLFQLFTRPAWRLDPYSTPDRGIFICSSSTPPGGGVHGLCGAHAAQSVLRGILH